MLPLLKIFLAVTLWVQVPQWNDDWSNCAVDVPDTSCHWYIVQADDNTFGEGFDWETAPWYSIEGLQDIAESPRSDFRIWSSIYNGSTSR